MDESIIPSLSTGVVGSRFVSQNDLDTAKARREEQWKAAYARFLGNRPIFTSVLFVDSTQTQTRPRTATAAAGGFLRRT